MHLAKLNTGHIVQVLRYNVPTKFDPSRSDQVLVQYEGRFKNLRWTNTTCVVWHHEFKDVK